MLSSAIARVTVSANESASHFIDGAMSRSRSDVTLDVINPSNGRKCLTIPSGCDADVDRAVGSARGFFEGGCWSESPPLFKKTILHRQADLIAREASAL